MSKHLTDRRKPSTGGRLKHFLRLAKAPRDSWHRPHSTSGQSRLTQFLRIARGRTA